METQKYLKCLYPKQARIILQCRSKTLDIKQHRPYSYSDIVCRSCGREDENVEHIINCGQEEIIDALVMYNAEMSNNDILKVMTIALRIESFLEKVSE